METSEVLIFGKDEIGGQFLKDLFLDTDFKATGALDQSEAFQILENKAPAIVVITSVSSDMTD